MTAYQLAKEALKELPEVASEITKLIIKLSDKRHFYYVDIVVENLKTQLEAIKIQIQMAERIVERKGKVDGIQE